MDGQTEKTSVCLTYLLQYNIGLLDCRIKILSEEWVNLRVVVWLVHPLSVPACSEVLTFLYTSAAGKSNGINLIVPTQWEKNNKYVPVVYDFP